MHLCRPGPPAGPGRGMGLEIGRAHRQVPWDLYGFRNHGHTKKTPHLPCVASAEATHVKLPERRHPAVPAPLEGMLGLRVASSRAVLCEGFFQYSQPTRQSHYHTWQRRSLADH
jgi:hypothetical protein